MKRAGVHLWGLGGAAIGLVALMAGCRSVPPAPAPPAALLAPPGLAIEVSSYAGTCVGGPLVDKGPDDVQADPRQVLPLVVELWATRAVPSSLADQPLAEHIEAVLVDEEASALGATARLFTGARLVLDGGADEARGELKSAEASEALRLYHGDELVSAGMTFRLRASRQERVPDPDNFLGEYPRHPPFEKAVELAFECQGERFGWLAGLSSAVLPSASEGPLTPEEARYRPGGPRARHERIVPDTSPVPGSRAMLFLPSPFDSEASGRGLALFFELGEAAGDEASPEELAKLGTRLATSLGRVADEQKRLAREVRAAGLDAGGRVRESAERTIAQLPGLIDAGVDLRPALVFLSGALEAPLARELVLVLDASALVRVTSELVAASKQDSAKAPFDPRWSLEAAAWRELARALSAGDERPPELRKAFEGIALAAAGQLGGFPTLIEDALASSARLEDFEARLVSENLIFLEDSSPAARVRALAWLKRRHAAPRGYDPLAPRKERAAMLEAANTKEQGQ